MMCNAYNLQATVGASDLFALISEEIAKLPSRLIRRSDRGPVVSEVAGKLTPSLMRWGFAREKYNSINNARSENLKRGMWVEPMKNSRCLVPMSSFYEWKPLIGRAKQPYELRLPHGGWLWVAGLYEESEQYGPCYATLTTEPTLAVSQVHDRLLAIVDFDEGLEFLCGGKSTFKPYEGKILMTPCESPLIAKKPSSDDPQGRLF